MVDRILKGRFNNKMASNGDVIKSSAENGLTALAVFKCGN